MQKIDASWMCILVRFFGFWEPTWLQNGVKLGIKNALLLSLIEKGEHPKNTYFSNRILIILGFGWPNIGAKIDQKSIKTRPQHGKPSWHRSFFGMWSILARSWRPSWPQVEPQHRSNIDVNISPQTGLRSRLGRVLERLKRVLAQNPPT